MRYMVDGDDLVARERGKVHRLTRPELERKPGKEALELIEVLERSMEVNKALWKTTYPSASSST